jgi:hypothetical protein
VSDDNDIAGFIARWSRRKHEAASDRRPENDVAPPRDDEVQTLPAQTLPQQPAQPGEAEAAAVDLSQLPSLDSIDAQTDVRAFLQKGVPADLSRAALRRAWAADPAIRDFIGLSENSFDFNSGEIPGFGPLAPDFDVAGFANRIFEGSAEEKPAPPARAAGEEQPEQVSPALPAGETTSTESQMRGDPATDQSEAVSSGGADDNEKNIASQQDEPSAAARAQRHGSALPKA